MLKATVKCTLSVNVPQWFVDDSGDLEPADIVWEWLSSGMTSVENVEILDSDRALIEEK